jgi:hypothetical protein
MEKNKEETHLLISQKKTPFKSSLESTITVINSAHIVPIIVITTSPIDISINTTVSVDEKQPIISMDYESQNKRWAAICYITKIIDYKMFLFLFDYLSFAHKNNIKSIKKLLFKLVNL